MTKARISQNSPAQSRSLHCTIVLSEPIKSKPLWQSLVHLRLLPPLPGLGLRKDFGVS